MAASLNIPWRRGAAPSVSMATVSAQFGDGYSAIAKAGINPRMETWEIETAPLLPEDALDFSLALDNLGSDPFVWTNPHSQARGPYYQLKPVDYQITASGALQTIKFKMQTYNGVAP